MKNTGQMTYEEAVDRLRQDPNSRELITASYLDKNVESAAKRFVESEECAELIKLIASLGVPKGGVVLDLGCGNGIVSAAFAANGYQVKMVDPDESEEVGLGAAKSLVAKISGADFEVKQGTAENIPLEDNSIDLVYLRQAVHHFENINAGFKDIFRVLKPGGVLIASREHVVNDQAQLDEFLNNHPMQSLHGGEYAYAEKEYVSAIELGGLKVKDVIKTYDSPINFHPIKSQEIRSWFVNAWAKRITRPLAKLLISLPIVEHAYRRKLSRACNYAGRLYTFTARKPSLSGN